MISDSEVEQTAERWAVPEAQIWRDWAVSHLLLGIAEIQHETSITFYGGTALCRTWCQDLRFSEDIDLLVAGFPDAAELIQTRLSQLSRRTFPNLSWTSSALWQRTLTTTAETGYGTIKVQFVEPRVREELIPVIAAPVALRYSDLPASTQLNVPTAEGFAAMKLMAWHQRQAPRDLFDLAALADAGAITRAAIELTQSVSSTRIDNRVLDQRLTDSVLGHWETQLGHQRGTLDSAETCLAKVVQAVRELDD